MKIKKSMSIIISIAMILTLVPMFALFTNASSMATCTTCSGSGQVPTGTWRCPANTGHTQDSASGGTCTWGKTCDGTIQASGGAGDWARPCDDGSCSAGNDVRPFVGAVGSDHGCPAGTVKSLNDGWNDCTLNCGAGGDPRPFHEPGMSCHTCGSGPGNVQDMGGWFQCRTNHGHQGGPVGAKHGDEGDECRNFSTCGGYIGSGIAWNVQCTESCGANNDTRPFIGGAGDECSLCDGGAVRTMIQEESWGHQCKADGCGAGSGKTNNHIGLVGAPCPGCSSKLIADEGSFYQCKRCDATSATESTGFDGLPGEPCKNNRPCNTPFVANTTACSPCGGTGQIDLCAGGHTPGAAATCTSAQTCTVCSTVIVAALSHSWGGAATCTSAQTCTACGAANSAAPALGHDYGTSKGDGTHECKRAGCSYYTSCAPSSAIGDVCTTCGYITTCAHTWGATQIKPATCLTASISEQFCTTAGCNGHRTYPAEYVPTPALGHTPGPAATCISAQSCTVCAAVIAEATGVHTPGPAATCLTAQSCTVCAAVIVPATGHTLGPAATCLTAQSCTVCAAVIVAATGHTPGAAATCITAQSCTTCAAVIAAATGNHTLGAWAVSTPPAVGVPGVETALCTTAGCTYSETRAIAPLEPPVNGGNGENGGGTITPEQPAVVYAPEDFLDDDVLIDIFEEAIAAGETPVITVEEDAPSVISSEVLQVIKELGEDVIVELPSGITFTIIADSIGDDAQDFDLNIEIIFTLDDEIDLNGAIVPANSIKIAPNFSGDFGFDIVITFTAEDLEEAGLSAEGLMLFYIAHDGTVTFIGDAVVLADGSVEILINSASAYVLSNEDLVELNEQDNPPTGVIIAIIPALLVGSLVVVANKRKKQ